MRFADKTPGGGHILGAECPHTAAAPAARVLGVLQNGGGIRKDLQTPRKADIGGKVVIRRALALITQGVRLGVQPQPVAVLEARLPQPVFAALALDKLDPVLHAVVAVLQNALVAVGAVECPRQHGHHIASSKPSGSRLYSVVKSYNFSIKARLSYSTVKSTYCGSYPSAVTVTRTLPGSVPARMTAKARPSHVVWLLPR